MSNAAFLWMVNQGIELGLVTLCLILLRVILRRTAPRLFSYLLWCTLPVTVLCNFLLRMVSNFSVQRLIYLSLSSPLEMSKNFLAVVKLIWLLGLVTFLITLLLTHLQFRRWLVGSIRLRKNIYLASRITTPFTIGLLWPKIYLPTSVKQEYHEAVILHEQVHIRRKDIWMKNFALLFLALFWFQPLLWLAYRLFVNDMEEACDEAVLKEKGEEYSSEYAKVLVEVSYQAGKLKGVAVGYGGGEVKNRVKNVLRYKRARFGVYVATFLCFVLFVALMIPLSWSVPQVVKKEFSLDGSPSVIVEQSKIKIKIGTEVVK
ncbi:MAG: M56 family metallopeptidase [Lachnospiraceae bacterium]|nr:M56 family metallopeptidase [Lachnospiraceae bacterium]